jgi:hypothetical protein
MFLKKYIVLICRSSLSPILPILVAEMSEHHSSLDLIPIDTWSTDNWADDILAAKFESLQRTKTIVNKIVRDSADFGSKDLKQIELVFDLSKCEKEVRESFEVFRNDSEIGEFFQSTAVHVLSTDSEKSKFDNLKEFESPTVSFGVFQTIRHPCPRCRLFLSNVENELCVRCHSIVY